MRNKYFVIFFMIMGLSSLIMASSVSVWQGQYYNETSFLIGNYTFNFSVYDSLAGGNICYSNQTDLETGNWGQWKTEQFDVGSSCNNASQEYFLNINIEGTDQVPRRRLTVWDYLRRDVSDVSIGNITLGDKIVFRLGEIIDNLIDNWITINGNLNVTENVTASYFFGDGSGLTNLPSVGDNVSWNESYADTKYAEIIWGYNQSDGSYNATYDLWAYNQSDGSYNATYDLWSYNQTLSAINWVDSQAYLQNGTGVWLTEINSTGNITTEEIHFEQDPVNHRIYDNSTCVIIRGDTSDMYIC